MVFNRWNGEQFGFQMPYVLLLLPLLLCTNLGQVVYTLSLTSVAPQWHEMAFYVLMCC